MKEVCTPSCTCGKTMIDNTDRCSACAQIRQKRMSAGYSYNLPERPKAKLTPPPTQLSSPPRSYEITTPPTGMRRSYANEILTSALATQEGSSSLLPPSFYQARSAGVSRRTSNSSSISSSPAINSLGTSEQTARKLSRSTTPDPRAVDGSYAPMAAGFARLSRKESYNWPASDQSRRSGTRSLDLGARMFSGPA